MDSTNPYAPPKVQDSVASLDLPTAGCSADDRYLYLTHAATLPDRCAVTNQPLEGGDRVFSRKFIYTPPWVYLLLFVHLLVMIIVAIAVRKSATATYWLSEGIRRRYVRRRGSALGLIGVAALGIFAATRLQDSDWVIGLVMLGFILILLALIGLMLATPLKVRGYKRGTFRISGCSPDFLASLPRGGYPPKQKL